MLEHYRLDFVWIEIAAPGVPRVRSAYTHTHAIDILEAARQARAGADLLMILSAARVDVTITPADQWGHPSRHGAGLAVRFAAQASSDAIGAAHPAGA